jgi:hypothetical protein
MLEPLGRLGEEVPRQALTAVFAHPYPEVRAAGLYYVRQAALIYGKRDNLDLVVNLLKAPEYQLRLQAMSVIAELPPGRNHRLFMTHEQLLARCQNELHDNIKEHCLNILLKRKEQE